MKTKLLITTAVLTLFTPFFSSNNADAYSKYRNHPYYNEYVYNSNVNYYNTTLKSLSPWFHIEIAREHMRGFYYNSIYDTPRLVTPIR